VDVGALETGADRPLALARMSFHPFLPTDGNRFKSSEMAKRSRGAKAGRFFGLRCELDPGADIDRA